MSDTTTRGVRITVKTVFLPERSSEEDNYFFFAYRVAIANVGEATVQLVSRHWVITDGDGHTEDVKGPGVVGEQPLLRPGQSFEYTSFCPLKTPVGTMHGIYQMIGEEGEPFDAIISPFSLAVPGIVN
jgi:ApaG protein